MNKEAREHLAAHRKYVILEYAKGINNNKKACQDFNVPKSSFYEWKKAYAEGGKAGLLRRKPIARNHPRQIPPEFVEKIIHLRTKYHLGPQRIAWYLERYHGFKTSCSSVYRTFKRNGIGPPAPKYRPASHPYPPLRQTGPRPSNTGRREVPEL